jgi:hypothetical protein
MTIFPGSWNMPADSSALKEVKRGDVKVMVSTEDKAQKEIAAALAEGLMVGFASNSSFSSVKRGVFAFQSSSVKTQNFSYEDQWLRAKTGGGQEVVKVGSRQFTRLYAGGLIDQAKLEKLSITEFDVNNFLKSILKEHRAKVRLFSNCPPIARDQWTYSYEILVESPSVSLTVSREIISYQEEEVFVHAFLLCPVR